MERKKYTIDFLENNSMEKVLETLNDLVSEINCLNNSHIDFMVSYKEIIKENKELKENLKEYYDSFSDLTTGIKGFLNLLFVSKKYRDSRLE
jgi:hypothetical protein